MGYLETALSGLRKSGCEHGYIQDPWEFFPAPDEACNLPEMYLKITAPLNLVLGYGIGLYCLHVAVWLIRHKIHLKHPVDILLMASFSLFSCCGSGSFAFPAYCIRLDRLALPFGLAWTILPAVVLPSILQASFFKENLKAVVILDPGAERSLDQLFNNCIKVLIIWGVPWGVGVWLLAIAKNRTEETLFKVMVTVCIVICLVAFAASFLRVWFTLFNQPPSALAYAEEFPEHKKRLRQMQLMTMTAAVLFGIVAVLCVPLLLFLLRRYFYTVCSLLCLVVQPAFFVISYTCKAYHQSKYTAVSAVQQLPATKARNKTNWKASLITQVTSEFCTEANSKVVMQFQQGDAERDGSTSDSGIVAKRGVSLQFLKQFVSEFGVSKEETTHSMTKRVIKKHSEPVKRSYYSMLAGGRDKYGKTWVGEQSVFVSHSWGCQFDTLVQVLTEFERKNLNCRGAYYFIDVFVMNQHSIDTEKKKNDDSVYKRLLKNLDDSVRQSDKILVVLNQYAAPEALTRIWCLFEIWRSALLRRTIVMGFTKREAVRFARAVYAAEINIDDLTESVDAASARATDPYDLAMIRRSIESSIGEDKFNEDLRKKLMAHLVDCAVHTSFERRSAPVTQKTAHNRIMPATQKGDAVVQVQVVSTQMEQMAASLQAIETNMAIQQVALQEQSRALQEQSRALQQILVKQSEPK